MGNEIREMARSDHEGLTDHEKHVVFSSCIQSDPLEGLEQKKDMANTRFREPLWLLYLSKHLVHSRCSLNVSSYHFFQPHWTRAH